ncbi:hypothetical protein ACFYYY_22345 [Streptomyces sp. NPDC001834]|uniref:hypothetical protein n=1 Tax=Streptomyces sp. NPDC001834 TaxID=3364616 RepID=UPI0036C36EEE
MSPFPPRSVRRRAPLLRGLLAAFPVPLLTLDGTVLGGPGTASAAPAVRVAHPAVADPDAPCTSNDPVVRSIREMASEERAEAREIRIRYHQLLDSMEAVEARRRAEGRSDEEIARVLVARRNEAKEITRAGMSPEAVEALEARNMAKRGNPLGPTADQRFARYGIRAAVIDAATRSNAAVDRELGRPARALPAGPRSRVTSRAGSRCGREDGAARPVLRSPGDSARPAAPRVRTTDAPIRSGSARSEP